MAPATGRREDRSSKAFRALLALYPAAFRDEYGRELRLLFIDRYRDAASPWDRALLWFDALAGIAVEAPKEHFRMLIQDLRYATRSLLKHRVMTFTIVMTLGLGIGANAAIFSLLNAVVLRSLPVSDPDQLFAVRGAHPLASGNRFTGPMLEQLRRSAPPDVALAAMSRVARVYIRTPGQSEVEPAEVQLVSSNYFPVLGLRPVLGRMLPDVAATEPAPVAVISHRYWQRRFGGRDDVLGRELTINGGGFTIIGVGPERFSGVWLESPVDLWVPLSMDRQVVYWGAFSAPSMCMTGCLVNPMLPWYPQPVWWLDVVARAPAGRAAATASAFNAAVQDFLRQQEPAKRDARIALEPFAKGFSAFRRRFETPLYVLVAMAALVLLIACANVANLLLARAAGRQREMAIRVSLGAGRARLLHQLLTESVLLVLLAAGTALLFARWSADLLIQTASGSAGGQPPFAANIDYRVWGFTAAVAFLSVVLFGLLPAWRTTRLDLAAAVKAGARGSAGASTTRPARFLVVAQVALALVLVTGMGLLVRSFHNLLNVDLGFDRHLISVTIDPAPTGWKPEEFVQSLLRVLDSVASVPSVQSAALAGCGLLTGCGREDGLQIEGYAARPDEQVVFVANGVTPGYFATIGTRLVAGRSFDDHDVASGPKVAVVNRALATKYFGSSGFRVGRNPIRNHTKLDGSERR